MTKTERKVIEKLVLSAYALHLYEGLTIHENYSTAEAIRYWRYAKEDPGAIAPRMFGQIEPNVYGLMDDYHRNVENLERTIAERVKGYKDNPERIAHRGDKEDRIELSIAVLPPLFELRAFPGVPMRVLRGYSYVNDSNEVQLVLERIDKQLQFGKGTLAEIRAQISKEVKP